MRTSSELLDFAKIPVEICDFSERFRHICAVFLSRDVKKFIATQTTCANI